MNITTPQQQPCAISSGDSVRVFSQGSNLRQEKTLLTEHMLEVSINEIPAYQIVCSPTLLPEMVLGRLLSEGIIRGPEEVEMIYLCKDSLRARVFLNKEPTFGASAPETVASCCTGNRTLVQLIGPVPQKLRPIAFEREWIFDLANALNKDIPLYDATHSTHSCMLQCRGEIIARSEDIGRHNAMDKVFGWAMRRGVDLGQCILYTSGRVPVDMTLKAIRAGVPVLVSKALPTDQAVELAREFGLTMIGAAHPDSFEIFTEFHP